MTIQGEDKTVRELISEVSHDFSELIREEMALAKAEMRHGLKQLGRGIAFLVIAAFVINAGMLALVASLVLGLSTAMAAWLSALIVGAVLAVVGAVLLSRGMSDMKNAELKPERTLETLKEDARIIRGKGHE